MDKKFISLFGVLFLVAGCYAQSNAPTIFTIDDFLQQVKKYHPLAKQADIQVDKALAELMAAKGAFDPALDLDASRKTLDGKNYYYYTNPELIAPLPVGNLKTGIENNGGSNLSSEITKGKSSYIGLEIPLAKGLMIDKRRAVLQQAKILRSQSEQERLLMFNNLLFDASLAYWQWAASQQQYMAYSKFVAIASKRMRLVRIAFANGDRAMADTIEAYTQIQNYQLLQEDALLKLNNAKMELANYLWLENYTAFQLPDNYVSDRLSFANTSNFKNVEDLLAQSATQNPALQMYDYKLKGLEVERRLKAQSLLPYFTAKANLLSKDYYAPKNFGTNYLENNYKWGIDIRFSLYLREARGDYKKAQLKIKETNLELLNKRQQTENKIRSYYNEFYALAKQLQISSNMYVNYQALLHTEELKFEQGESSLFLVNSRETKVIEILQKQIDLALKCYKAKYAMEWAAGILK
ncbi:TolC family protein [Parasediminibacterium sp. JCM 36343]|uniref:TolC family protein n=1 Tax=Parasediminibacterium sp. JCM 36343 TaxID=3374279 RepID=UPI00397BC4BC